MVKATYYRILFRSSVVGHWFYRVLVVDTTSMGFDISATISEAVHRESSIRFLDYRCLSRRRRCEKNDEAKRAGYEIGVLFLRN